MPILGNGRGQKRGYPQELGITLFFMMLGDHIQCISEEISFIGPIGFCLTFSAIIGWITPPMFVLLIEISSKFIIICFYEVQILVL